MSPYLIDSMPTIVLDSRKGLMYILSMEVASMSNEKVHLTNDSIPSAGKRLYRFPTQIAWSNGGFKVFEARDVDEAMNLYNETFPNMSKGYMSLANAQVKTGGEWKFASEVPAYLGGYSQRYKMERV